MTFLFLLFSSRLRSHLFALLRVGALLIVCNVLLALFCLSRARADINEALLSMGAPFLNLPGSEAHGVQSLQVNGAIFHTQSMSLPQPWRRVLASAANECKKSGLVELDQKGWEAVASADPTGSASQVLRGVWQVEGEDEGVLICLQGQHPTHLQEWLKALQDFAHTGALSTLGRPRYVRVRRTKDGGSVLLTVWSDAVLNLKRMFPESGDSPGKDAEWAARPPGSRRVFSATTTAAGPAVTAYHSRQPPETLRTFYRNALTKDHWALASGTEILSGTRPDQEIRVQVQRDANGGSWVTLSQL